MGTSISALSSPADAAAVAPIVRAVFESWDARFSRFRPDSELSRLNATAGSPFAASDLMIDVVAASLEAAQLSEGLFDPAPITPDGEIRGEHQIEAEVADRVDDLVATGPESLKDSVLNV